MGLPPPPASARARVGLHERVRTRPYSPLSPYKPKPRCASPGARAPPSARRGKGDEMGRHACARRGGWGSAEAARLQAARGVEGPPRAPMSKVSGWILLETERGDLGQG